MTNNDLLNPSLSNNVTKTKLFSEQALFFTAFFGTAFAVSIMSAINSYKLQRLKKDFLIYVLGCTIYAIAVYSLIRYGLSNESKFVSGDIRLTVRIASIIIWFIFFSVHKKTHRINSFIAESSANPWLTGLVCVIAGSAIQFALIKFLLSFGFGIN